MEFEDHGGFKSYAKSTCEICGVKTWGSTERWCEWHKTLYKEARESGYEGDEDEFVLVLKGFQHDHNQLPENREEDVDW